jgi:hypothetical protein
MTKSITYRLLHLFEGDRFCEPMWVRTGDFCTFDGAIAALKETKANGFNEFQLLRITTEELMLPDLEEKT